MTATRKKPLYRDMRIGVSLALFAISILYVAPLVSQLTLSHHSMGMLAHEPYNQRLHTHQHSSHQRQHIHDHGLEAACGYCSLLFHLSWLDIPEIKWLRPFQEKHFSPLIYTPLILLQCVYVLSLPRAPPLSVFSR